MSPLLIGMLIVGFGTSAPEIVVTVQASLDGNPGLALGNALGSNISNIGLILGLTALVAPIVVHSRVLREELPVLLAATLVLGFMISDGDLSRVEGVILLVLAVALVGWSVFESRRQGESDALAADVREAVTDQLLPKRTALLRLVIGLIGLVLSARLLVWGAVSIATQMGISQLLIGLTIVALGTSLPELAASIVAVRKNEHEIALGNVLGSNLFNTLVAVGLASFIAPTAVEPAMLNRDWMMMMALSVGLFVFGFRLGGSGRINRLEAAMLVVAFSGYMTWLVVTALGAAGA